MPLLETQLARYFMQVAHAKSLSKAAIKLSTTQSNVTARIKQLEEQLGAQLFSRHSRGVALTAAGEVLLPYCEQIVKIAEAVQRQAASTGFSRPSLRVGVYHTAAAHLMPDLIAGFLSANRGVHLTVKMGSTDELRALVREEQLDCAVIAAVAVDSALHVHSRFVDEMGWVFKVGLLSRSDADVMAQLASMPIYATQKGALYEASVRQLFQDEGLTAEMPVFQELGSTEILRAVLHLGHGFTFISKAVFLPEIESGIFEFHPLANQLPRLHPVLVTRTGGHQSTILADFVDYFTKATAASLKRRTVDS